MRAIWVRRTVGVACAVICAVVFGSATGAQSDPIVGSWRLDLAHSTYKPGPPPRGQLVVIEAAGKGIKVAVDSVGSDGTEVKWGYTSARDGKDAPVSGNPNYDTANVTQTSPTEGTILQKGRQDHRDGEDVGVERRQEADRHLRGRELRGSTDEQRRRVPQAVIAGDTQPGHSTLSVPADIGTLGRLALNRPEYAVSAISIGQAQPIRVSCERF